MGITTASLKRIRPYIKEPKSILLIGCQNIYTAENNGGLAYDYFTKLGHSVRVIDITGCQGSEVYDLREPFDIGTFDIVADHGSLEHVSGNYYQAHRNIHNATKVGGIIIHENPKTGNWPGHGCNYVDMDFYIKLADLCNYEILELTEEAAMGNTTDGWNISVVLRKLDGSEFISEDKFKTIGHVFAI